MAAISISAIVLIVASLLLLVLLALAVYKRWYVQVALVAVAAMCVALFVLGVQRLVDGDPGTNVLGAVLAAIGAVLLLATAVGVKLLYFKRPAQGD